MEAKDLDACDRAWAAFMQFELHKLATIWTARNKPGSPDQILVKELKDLLERAALLYGEPKKKGKLK